MLIKNVLCIVDIITILAAKQITNQLGDIWMDIFISITYSKLNSIESHSLIANYS